MTQFILMPTLQCDAVCDYCFQARRGGAISHEDLSSIFEKLADYLDEKRIGNCAIYWLGGELFTLSPDWFMKAHAIVKEMESRRNKQILNHLQSNLMTYSARWDQVITEMFGGEVGSSLDYPNLHRRLAGGTVEAYNRVWIEKYNEAVSNGIRVGVISVPNVETLKRGAAEYASFYFDEVGIRHLHVYPPLCLGSGASSDLGFPLDPAMLGKFYRELVDIWIGRAYPNGITISPFDQLLDYFMDGNTDHLSCEMSANCAGRYLCCDPEGNIMQCDCWTNFPDFWYGNALSGAGFSEVMQSPALQEMKERPGYLVTTSECLDCHYLTICHGGCPARALSSHGTLFERDPYCEALKILFEAVETVSRTIDAEEHHKNRLAHSPDFSPDYSAGSCNDAGSPLQSSDMLDH